MEKGKKSLHERQDIASLSKSDLLALWRSKTKKKKTDVIERLPLQYPVLASKGQKRLHILQELNPQNPFYQYGHLFKIRGHIDIEHMNKCFIELVQKHEILRSNFRKSNNLEIELLVSEDAEFRIREKDLSKKENDDIELIAQKVALKLARKTFDLEKDLLLRVLLIKLGENEYWLVISMHHIIADRASLRIMINEVFRLYRNAFDHKEIHLNKPEYQFSDFAYSQNKKSINQNQRTYWKRKLSGELPILDLPHDNKRLAIPNYQGSLVHMDLSPNLSMALDRLAQEFQVTNFVLFLTFFKILLYRYTNQKELIIGSPFSNRDNIYLENMIGFFNETLVLKTEYDGNLEFQEILAIEQKNYLEAFENKDIGFGELLKSCDMARHGNINPIFQAMFLYNKDSPFIPLGHQISYEEEMMDIGISKFDLTLFVNEQKENTQLSLEYSTSLFERKTAVRLLEHMKNLLTGIFENRKRSISDLPLLSQEERQIMINQWNNNNNISAPSYISVLDLIEEQVKSKPSHEAISYDGSSISYKELWEKSDAIANSMETLDSKKNTTIGILMERGIEMMIGILGIMKAGYAYLPLDPEYPQERLMYMITDSRSRFVLTKSSLLLSLKNAEAIAIDYDVSVENQGDYSIAKLNPLDNAYIIYTSGSSGMPKGVPISHRNLTFSNHARFHYYPEAPKVFLLLSSFSFDSSIAGIFWTLSSGGTLVISAKRLEQDVAKLGKLICEKEISHSLMLPSLYSMILSHIKKDDLTSLRNVIVAGDSCPHSLIKMHYKFLPNCDLHNEYGPTEGTIWSIAHKLTPEENGFVPIGKSIPYYEAYILNEAMRPCPIGVKGELYISGEGLCTGYLYREELTKAKFLSHPFKKNKKLYNTGDLARYHSGGRIEFLGRSDNQVKIRGFRVELSEITKIILKSKIVEEAHTLVKDNEDNDSKIIIAFVSDVPTDQLEKLKTYIANHLPSYMVPATCIPIETFPKLPNGKVNIKALENQLQSHNISSRKINLPRNITEEKLLGIWQEVLKLKEISITDNFFSIGGDSIQSIYLVSKAKDVGIHLSPSQIFQFQTIKELSDSINKSKLESSIKGSDNKIIIKLKSGKRTPLFCIHSGGGYAFFYKEFAQHFSSEQPIYSIQATSLDGEKVFQNSILEMATTYISEIKKVQAHGPYQILGTCFSNAVVLEIAHLLYKEGHEVSFIAIVDSAPVHLFGNSNNSSKKTMSRFIDIAKRGDYNRIRSKIKGRIKRILKPKNIEDYTFNLEENLEKTVFHLNKLYANYHWSPFPGVIHLFRSSEFAARKDKTFHIQQWKKLALKGLEVHITEGHHISLFKNPEAKYLSLAIENCIQYNMSISSQ